MLLWAVPLRAADDPLDQATKLVQSGKLHEAELLLRDLARRYPKSAPVHNVLGVTLA